MRSFGEIWNAVHEIPSAVGVYECEKLYDIAADLAEDSLMVELGCACGRSTAVLGAVARDKNLRFITIDPFKTDYWQTENRQEAIDFFKKNMQLLDTKYELLIDYSQNVALDWWGHEFETEEKVDFLFIDGDHRYRGVRLDCELWIPFVKRGNYILFDDYSSSWEGVKKAVDEREDIEKIMEIENSILTRKIVGAKV